MKRKESFFRGLCAGDVVHRTALVLKQEMRVDKAEHLLLTQRLRAAPVADRSGKCVGVLSVGEILRWNLNGRPSGPSHVEATTCVWCDWQIVEVKSTGRDDIVHCMIRNPLLVTPDTRLAKIAKSLIDPHRRPVVVVDEARRPIGLLSSEDLLAVQPFAERSPKKKVGWGPEICAGGSNVGNDSSQFAHDR
jgi:CBS domain-containing protein